jgi:RimJ/RimL family protein N-acetyltransferase
LLLHRRLFAERTERTLGRRQGAGRQPILTERDRRKAGKEECQKLSCHAANCRRIASDGGLNVATPVLETARLILRPVALDDVEQLQATFPQWEIVRYLSNEVPWPYPPDGALVYIRDVALPAMAAGTLWMWTLRLKSDPERIVGAIDLKESADENRGFWIAPPLRGRGLMTEAADAVTDFWFDVLVRSVLRVPKAGANEPSRRISMKQGMRIVATEERDYVSGRQPVEIWEITAEEWRRRRKTPTPNRQPQT